MSRKICLLTDSLSSGGAEKVVANLSISFFSKGYNVTIVSMKDDIDYQYKGSLYNFGKIKEQNNKFQSFIKFRNFFKKQNFDFIIDHRIRTNFFKELVFKSLIFSRHKVIYCFHNSFQYLPVINSSILAKLTLSSKKEFVVVSKSIKEYLKNSFNFDSKVIYNFTLPINCKKKILLEYPYIIGVGRLEKIKQFDVLIKSYKNTKLPENNIKLLIFGEGKERNNLIKLIQDLELSNFVKLQGFKNNIEHYISESKALVLSSKSEGFPMVLIEAINLKTPIISFDCKSGPNEIIKHGKNGLLVKNQDSNELTKALNHLVLDKEFYDSIKRNIISTPNPFSEDLIINQWINLLESFS